MWLIYEDMDGEIVWGRIPDGAGATAIVDARLSAGGHADPGDVLAWLQGKAPDPRAGGNGWGDDGVLGELVRKIRRAYTDDAPGLPRSRRPRTCAPPVS